MIVGGEKGFIEAAAAAAVLTLAVAPAPKDVVFGGSGSGGGGGWWEISVLEIEVDDGVVFVEGSLEVGFDYLRVR